MILLLDFICSCSDPWCASVCVLTVTSAHKDFGDSGVGCYFGAAVITTM